MSDQFCEICNCPPIMYRHEFTPTICDPCWLALRPFMLAHENAKLEDKPSDDALAGAHRYKSTAGAYKNGYRYGFWRCRELFYISKFYDVIRQLRGIKP